MFQDQFLLGVVSGVVANIVMDIPEYTLWKIQLIRHPLSHYAGSLFLDQQSMHHTWHGSIVGFLADYTYSALLGIIFIYLLSAAQREDANSGDYLRKGVFYGAFIWLFSFGGLRSLAIIKLREVALGDTLIFFFLHLLFGLVLGWMARKNQRSNRRKTEKLEDIRT